MRVLRLSTSDESTGGVPDALRSAALCEQMLTEASGEQVDTIIRTAWPEDGLPDLLSRWVERYEPDIVFFVVPSAWVSFPTASLRLQQMRLPGARRLGLAGARVGRVAPVAHNAAFRLVQRAAIRTVGAGYFFEPRATANVVGQCLSRVLRREGVGLAVRGPEPLMVSAPRREQQRAAQRCLDLHTQLKATCEALHIPFAGQEHATPAAEYRRQHMADLLHVNVEGHAARAQVEGPLLIEAWRQSTGHDQRAHSPATTSTYTA